MDNSDITATDSKDEIIDPSIIKEYREQVTKRLKDYGYMNLLAGYVSSVFQVFESFLETEIDLVEDDIRLLLNEYNSRFFTYELERGLYTFKEFSEDLSNILRTEYEASINVINIEFSDITMQNKLVVRDGFIAKKIIENSLFSSILGFTSD